ncbi:MAG: preprotein translocase subunit SecE [candidate division WOR-3 bacterium]
MIFKRVFDAATKYLKEVIGELKKVSWTSRRELFLATLMVIILSFILSIFVGFFDFLFSGLLRLILR